MLARVVHQYPSHQLRCDSEKVGAILPLRISLIYEFEISLVHERRRLQRVLATLAPQVITGQTSQLAIDQRHQLFECRLVAFTPIDEKLRYAFAGLHKSVVSQSLQQMFGGREGIRAKPPR
jgi:hypothetical protein